MPTSMAPCPATFAAVPRTYEFAPRSSVPRSRLPEDRAMTEATSHEPSPSSDSAAPTATRREVLIAAAVLTVGGYLPQATAGTSQTTTRGKELAPNPFIRIASDDSITVIAKHLEMGQGVFTGLATIVAEELDADWAQIRVEAAPADAKLYNNLTWGPFQGTGGSSSIANSFDQLRVAGATARSLLVSAAAQRWKVPAAEITVKAGVVSHAEK